MRSNLASILSPVLLVALLAINGCHHGTRVATAPPPAVPVAGTPAPSFQSPSGKTYARTPAGPSDDDEPLNIPPVPPGGAPSGDNYHGTARMSAKLSVVSATPEAFESVGALLDSLPADETMRAKGIGTGPDSDRVPEEQRVVVVRGFIYASSKESDNDFHCIFGGDSNDPPRFMNVEVSALPPHTSLFFAPLMAARNEFKTFFTTSTDALPTRGYVKYDPPIPVKITGSIFFDVDHVPPAVGPAGMKPQTAWEIHPVSDIQFEP